MISANTALNSTTKDLLYSILRENYDANYTKRNIEKRVKLAIAHGRTGTQLSLDDYLAYDIQGLVNGHSYAVHVHRVLGFGKDRQFVPRSFPELLWSHIFGVISPERDTDNDLGFVSTERRYEAPMCCTPGASK